MLTSLDPAVMSMKWADVPGDVKVSASFAMPNNSLTAQSQALGDFGEMGAHRGRARPAMRAQVTCWG